MQDMQCTIGVNVYSNYCVFHSFNKQNKALQSANEIQKIKDVDLDNLLRVKNLDNFSSIPFMRNTILVKQRYFADIVF